MLTPALDRKANSLVKGETPAKPARERRYRLRGAAARFLHRTRHRVCSCGWRIGNLVAVMRNARGDCEYAGLQSCASVWACPVCASKIGVHRSAEVTALARAHTQAGGVVYMVTLTIQHSQKEKLADLRAAISAIWGRFNEAKDIRSVKAEFGHVGYLKVLEITHGRHGWHPHFHCLLFLEHPITEGGELELQERLFAAWIRLAEKRGLYVNPDALDMREASSPEAAAEYVGKWGTAAEIAKGMEKAGRNGSRSPWQILTDAARGCRRSKLLFREYAKATLGARQITYARGLRERYELRDALDDQAVADQSELGIEAEVTTVCHIEKDQWAVIVSRGLQGKVLTAAETGGAQAVADLLTQEGVRPPSLSPPDRRWFTPSKVPQWGLIGERKSIRKELEEWTRNKETLKAQVWDQLLLQRPRPPSPEQQMQWEREAFGAIICKAKQDSPPPPLKVRLQTLAAKPGTKAQHPPVSP